MTNENLSNPNTNQDALPATGQEKMQEQKPVAPRKALGWAAVALLVAVVLAGWGILRRNSAETVLAERTNEMAAPSVIATSPAMGTPSNSLVLPGNVTAYTDSPIYARTSGYLTRWYFDIGAKVRKGALLAVISSPEVDQQLSQAEADLLTAQANANNARIQAERYSGLVKSDAVSRQETDTLVNQASATASAVRSAQANVRRLRELQSFEKIYAPFDGVITARNVDTGQLIETGTGKELFHLQAVQTLRVYANLPQVYSQSVKNGTKIDLTFTEHPGKTYQGTLVRTADAIDPVSRTLPVEIDVDNRAGELLPGSLAQVHFKTSVAAPTLVVPATALIFRKEGLRVGTVINGNVAHLLPVVMGEDDGAKVQIVTGLSAGDRVIQDPPDSLIEGEKVTVVSASSQTGGKE
jgi:RND family efflux transporter MFP subunit